MGIEEKYAELLERIGAMGSALVAFSGGVDSGFLLYAAKEALGPRVLGVSFEGLQFPSRESEEAHSAARRMGVPVRFLDADLTSLQAFRANTPDRCYHCKKALFSRLLEIAKGEGLAFVLDGRNADDEKDFRPGKRASAELGVKAPLAEVGFTKDEIRALSREKGLPGGDLPSLACLATRIPYGEEITRERLVRIDGAEEYLLSLGLGAVRVRDHGALARIEVSREDTGLFLDESFRRRAVSGLKERGYSWVALDLEGYRTGAMNEVLGEH